ncbi:hypothetical protein RHSIM_Rhsim07G0167700 [Rhododendron simsii]|uniref:Uncharacterized protein n=1 Tax=Rhododendron simsii TaxID=118357 RepID=A0A834GMS6_RHOSS|nr:hypothetical protein RHSIM_Rhsim07G0167700 [Rhododendron simsii]
MSANGENTDKMSVFIKTRDENDPDVKAVESAVYGQSSWSSHASSSSNLNEITKQRFAGEMERMLHEKLMPHLKRMRAQMALFQTYRGTNQTEQVLNVSSEQPIIRASVGNDFQDSDQSFSHLPTHSPQLDG